MAEFYFPGVHATTSTGCFGNSAPQYGLNPPPYCEAAPPYPTKPQCDGMNAALGYQTNYPPYPQGPSCMPQGPSCMPQGPSCMPQGPSWVPQGPSCVPRTPYLPYPNTFQLPCVSPQYGNCQRLPPARSMACTIQNVAAPPPILPPCVNQQSVMSSYMVTQQSPLTPYKANRQLSSTLMVQSGSGVTVSNIANCYPASTQQPSKSLTKEIASAVLTKVIEHATKPKPKYKGNQLPVTIVTRGGSTIIHK
ncbi:phospholipid scramblase 1-like isoform X1 [Mobula hypostoma]|uniref:phospholipid scramblase 1-like isoform X1 n=2 Tax=Mobula hypostoma TaxID=723540 RepID=UPI002FC30DB3